jgi:hypothetical protein
MPPVHPGRDEPSLAARPLPLGPAHTGTNPLRLYVRDLGKEGDATYNPRILGFRVAEQLLNVRTLKVRIMNTSGSPAYVEDLVLHTSQSPTAPSIAINATTVDSKCQVAVSGVSLFRSITLDTRLQ